VTPLAIAHRAGNSLAALKAAVQLGADVFELDVHSHQGRLEVRHLKTMGPLPFLWDRWELVPASVRQLRFEELLEAADPTALLMVDLKGVGSVGPHVARVLHAHAPDREVLVCSRWWPSVDSFAGADWVRPVLSARTRTELARLRARVRRPPAPYGVSVHRSLLTAPLVAELRSSVEVVMSWPINDERTLDAVLAMGVNGVISDETHVLRTLLERRAAS
jgi:glycerophosphoryl diester phosphodiesterase